MAQDNSSDQKSNIDGWENRKNPLIVVTGASSGIGAACIIPFLKSGKDILMLSRNVNKMNEQKTNILKSLDDKTDYSSKLFIKKCDVTLTEPKTDDKTNAIITHSIVSAVDECLNENKTLFVDCLINNAGMMFLSQETENQSRKEWNLMINININGVLNGILAVVKYMKIKKRGTIINISSMAGKKHFDRHTVYCATKFAVQAITEGLRQEVCSDNIKVTVICPGAVQTNLLSHNKKGIVDDYSDWKQGMSLGVLMPEDVANACYFCYNQHPRCCIRELQLAPINQKA